MRSAGVSDERSGGQSHRPFSLLSIRTCILEAHCESLASALLRWRSARSSWSAPNLAPGGPSPYHMVSMADDRASRQADTERWLSDDSLAVEAKGLVEAVIERVAQLVGAGILRPGGRLPTEKQLMQAFGVGRSSVREALRSLVATNILESVPGKGYFVAPIGPSLVGIAARRRVLSRASGFHEVMEARHILEVAIGELAIDRATAEDIRRAEQSGVALRSAVEDRKELLPYTMRVHLAIATSAHNTVLLQLLQEFIPWIMAEFEDVVIPAEVDVQMHLDLLGAFSRRDPAALASAVRDHQVFWEGQYLALGKSAGRQNPTICSQEVTPEGQRLGGKVAE